MSRSNIFDSSEAWPRSDRTGGGPKLAVAKVGGFVLPRCSQAFSRQSEWDSELLERKYVGNFWSREWELNPRPADYESAALPLSYLGSVLFFNNLRGERLPFLAPSSRKCFHGRFHLL
jgi:hypothetical protein